MLPGISIKNISADDKKITEFKHRFKGLPVRRPLRNSRNSEILNSIIGKPDIIQTFSKLTLIKVSGQKMQPK